MNELWQVAAISGGILAWAVISRRLDKTMLTLPILFVGLGYLLGESGIGLLDIRINSSLLHGFAELTLVLVLFTDAAGVRLITLRKNVMISARMLLIGMPLTIILGTAVAQWVSPQAPLMLALLTAAILTPTDAALAQSILSSPKVPSRLRQAINVESGLNDGLVVPIITLAAVLSAQATGTSFHEAPGNLSLFIALQLSLGPLIGIGAGYSLARLLDWGIDRDYVSDPGRGIAVLAGALLCFAGAELAGGNGFIAAFLGGLTLGNTLKNEREFIVEFMEGEGQILTMLTFIIFGAVLMPVGLAHASWKTAVLAICFLSFVRMLPIWISLAGTGLRRSHKLCLGWFGPRGLASILFALLIDEQYDLPGFEELLACVVLTVLLSVVLHGASATPIATWLGRQTGTSE